MIKQCCVLFLVLVLSAALPSTHTTSPQSLDPDEQVRALASINALLVRVVGERLSKQFEIGMLRPSSCPNDMGECFQVGPADAPFKVTIRGSSLSSLTCGIGHYLRDSLNVSLTWADTGGLPDIEHRFAELPEVSAANLHVKSVKWTYYQNVVESSYSFVWWNWTRWQVELDWMALQGINLALAYNGQESVYRTLYRKFGLNDTTISGFFNGPAYLSWSRGQGQASVGGSLPEWWYEQQADLNQAILERMGDLGITGILPGFQGNVPKEMKQLYPNANISDSGWLDALDPLFTQLSDQFMQSLIARFGTHHHYQADGFFTHATGPWAKTTTSSSATTEASPRDHYSRNSENNDGGRDEAGAFSKKVLDDIVPDPIALAHSSAAFNGLARTDPNAVWVYQTWIWRNFDSSYLPYIKGWVSAVPHGRLLLLDQTAEWKPLWLMFGNYSFFGTPFIWCTMHNIGGNPGLFGDMSLLSSGPSAALALSASIKGVGFDPEGINQNPAYYQWLLDSVWSSAPPLQDWMKRWATQRCGVDSANARRAWDLLLETVYSTNRGQQDQYHIKYCPATQAYGAAWDTSMKRPFYDATLLYQAWGALIDAATDCSNNANTDNDNEDTNSGGDNIGYLFDLVDVGREYLSLVPCVRLYDQLMNATSQTDLFAANASLVEMLSDLDTLLQSHQGFLLGKWLSDARAMGHTNEDMELFEWNQRTLVTSWYPVVSPSSTLTNLWDYAYRSWAGLIGGYHIQRFKILTDFLNDHVTSGRGFDEAGYKFALMGWVATFTHQTWDSAAMPNTPIGNPVTLSRQLYEKYKINP